MSDRLSRILKDILAKIKNKALILSIVKLILAAIGFSVLVFFLLILLFVAEPLFNISMISLVVIFTLLCYKKKIKWRRLAITILLSLLIISSPYIALFLPYSLSAYPERHYPDKIKGIRFNTATILPMLLFGMPLIASDLKKLGVNSVYFPIFYRVNHDGSISALPFSETVARLLIKRFHSLGFSIAVSPALIGPEGLSFGALPEEVLENKKFWKELERVILDLSEMAEEEKVEILFVMNEPEVVLGLHKNATFGGLTRMINFSQKIVKEVRERFGGRVGWHAALGGDMVHYNWSADSFELFCPIDMLNFSDYDYYGSTIISVHPNETSARKAAEDLVRIQMEICNMSDADLVFPETFWMKDEQIDYFRFYFGYANSSLLGSFITLAPFGRERIEKVMKELYLS